MVECKDGILQGKKAIFPQPILDLVPSNYSGPIHFFALTQEKRAALDSLLAKVQEWKRVQDGAEERIGYRETIIRKDDNLYDAVVAMQEHLTDKLF